MTDESTGIKAPQFTPSPLNLFMNIPVHDDHTTISFEPPTSKAGEYVCLKAEVDLVIAFSACPQVDSPEAANILLEKTGADTFL